MSAETLLTLNNQIIELDKTFDEETKKYNELKDAVIAEKKRLQNKINLAKHSVDIEKFERGRRLLEIQFPGSRNYNTNKYKYSQIYPDLISAAKHDLSTGVKKLAKEYIGQKYYDGFDQRCDCKYGYSPRHGSIYQSIGLRNPETALTDEDIEACLYLLENFDVLLENINKSAV